MLTRIYTNLTNLLETIGRTNQEDLAKAEYPLYNIEFMSESSTFTAMQTLDNRVIFEIHAYNQNPETSNARFDNDNYLYKLLNDIKKVLYSDSTLGGICQEYSILGAQSVKLGNSEDILLSEKLVARVEYRYSQDRKDPSIIVGS